MQPTSKLLSLFLLILMGTELTQVGHYQSFHFSLMDRSTALCCSLRSIQPAFLSTRARCNYNHTCPNLWGNSGILFWAYVGIVASPFLSSSEVVGGHCWSCWMAIVKDEAGKDHLPCVGCGRNGKSPIYTTDDNQPISLVNTYSGKLIP